MSDGGPPLPGRDETVTEPSPLAPCPYAPGQVVAERFEILAPVGRGVTGTVYRARDLWCDNDAEIVALKAIHQHLHCDRQIFGRVRREASILKRIEGPNLVKLLDYIEEDGHLLLSLEYVDGPCLDDYVRERGPMPLAESIAILEQVCAALETAHEDGVIHRDLKPSNVLVETMRPPPSVNPTDDGDGGPEAEDRVPPSFLAGLRVKVVDFGLAKMVAGEVTGTALTEADMIFGTPDYMSPEQVSGEHLDRRSDVYAAAVILYELVCGDVPFDAPTALATMTAHLHEQPVAPSQRAPRRDVPPALDAVILRALHKDPAARFPSAAAFARALSTALHRAPGSSGSPEGLRAEAGDEAASDTGLGHSETAIHHTLSSERDSANPTGEGGRVRVVVRTARDDEATSADVAPVPPKDVPTTDPPRSGGAVTSTRPRSQAPPSLGATAGETRLWTVIAICCAVAAVAAGILLGVR
ncbi:MAG: serine/threonine-protein kinase [Myxococcota bacterium]